MGLKFNPLIFSGFDLSGGGPAGDVHWKGPVANMASLPVTGNTPGDIRVTLDTGNIWEWDGTVWFLPAVPYSEKGQANGVASLDGAGKVPYAQLPNAIMTYKGTWNPTTNTPTLADGTGQAGDVYRASVDGASTAPMVENWFAGDFIIYDGAIWQRSPLADGVVSVNGFQGVVTLTADDVGAANQSLSNLTNPTAVNQDLNMGTHNVSNAGRLSVGSTQQVGKIQVDNLISESAIPAISMRITDAPNFGFDIFQETGAGGDFAINTVNAGVSAEAFRIARADGAVTVRDQFNASHVAIGTTSQVGKLQVDNLIAESATPAISMRIADALGFGFDIMHDTSNTGDMYINRLNAGSANEAFRIARGDGLITVQNRIANVTDPVNPQDAATKSYADTKMSTNFSNATASTVALNLNSHQIHNVTDPSSNQDAATKNYVDTAILGVNLSAYFKKDGSVLATGDFDLDNHALKSVSVIDSVPGSDLDINAVPNTPFSSLLSTVSATVSGGLASPYSFATAVIGGKKYAYISTTSGNPIIQVFNLTDGTLVQEYHTSLGGSFFTGGNCVSNFANMLYLDDQNSHAQAAFNIDPSNGQILSQASPTLGWSGSEGGLACSSDGKILVFAGNSGTQSFTVDSSGNLTHVTTRAGTTYGSTPVFSPSGTWILNGTAGLTGEIMSVNPTTGVLGAVTNVTTDLTKFAISPDGLHIYDASGHIFSLDETTGAVTDLGITYPGSALNNPHCGTPVAVSPDGTTVITLDFTGVVASYSRNVITGALTLINSALLSTGNSSSLNIAASVTVTNDRILVPTGFDDTTAHVSKLYLFATPAQGKVKLNSLQIADGSEGTSGYVWTSTDTLGNGSWQAAGGGGSGANQTLSNLTGPTAINQDLIFDTGANSTLQTKNDATQSTQELIVKSGDATGFASGNLILKSGDATGSVNTGDILLHIGNTTTGTRGKIELDGPVKFNNSQKIPLRVTTGDVTVDPSTDYSIILNDLTAGAFNINLPAGIDGMTFKFAFTAAASTIVTTYTFIPNGIDTVDPSAVFGVSLPAFNGQGSPNVPVVTLAFVSGVWYQI